MSEQNAEQGPPWTTLKILSWMKGYFERQKLPSPRLEAELILQHALRMERIMLYAQFERPLEPDELATIRALVKRRAAREPMAYITGSRGFWQIELKTDRRALIPRPDTETLVEAALARLSEIPQARLLDIGTGTGAIALAIAHDAPEVTLAACDISAEALSLARENAQALKLTERVTLFESDLLAALPREWTHDLDMIVSNPPYIATDEVALMGEDVTRYEPHLALFAGEDGLDVLRRLVPDAHSALKPGGWLLCEIGFKQGEAVSALFERAGFQDIEVLQDLGGHDRVVVGQRS